MNFCVALHAKSETILLDIGPPGTPGDHMVVLVQMLAHHQEPAVRVDATVLIQPADMEPEFIVDPSPITDRFDFGIWSQLFPQCLDPRQ